MLLDILLCLLWPWFGDFWGLFWVHLGLETLKNQLKLEFRTILSNNPTSNIENWCQFEIWQNFSLLLLLYTGSADGARRACAKGRATRNDAVTRDVLYVLQLIEVTQFLAENATCPQWCWIVSELLILALAKVALFKPISKYGAFKKRHNFAY